MRFSWRAAMSFWIVWALAVSHLAAGVPRNDPPDKKEKPVFIIAVLIGMVEPSCRPGQPVALLKVRVTNKGRVSTPALPASDGLEAQDSSTPPWRGTAALPALRPGEAIEVAIPLQPPANLLPGKHAFQVTVNPRHVIEQEHYQFNSAGPLVIEIPVGLCRTASIAPGVENLPPPNTPTGRSPKVPERSPQPGPSRNTPRRNNTAEAEAYSKAAIMAYQKPGVSLTITPAAQAYTLTQSCAANQPVLILHFRITNTGTTQLPTIPYSTAIMARDTGNPVWQGGTGLWVLNPGASEDRDISLYPPSQPRTVAGVHHFTVSTLGFSSAPIGVNVPVNYCPAQILPNVSPKAPAPATQAKRPGR